MSSASASGPTLDTQTPPDSPPTRGTTGNNNSVASTPGGKSVSSTGSDGEILQVVYSGWLSKQPSGNSLTAAIRYQKRFFMLTNQGALHYSTKKITSLTTKSPTTSWSLANILGVNIEEPDHLQLLVKEGEEQRLVILKGSAISTKEWFDKFKEIGVPTNIEIPAEVSPKKTSIRTAAAEFLGEVSGGISAVGAAMKLPFTGGASAAKEGGSFKSSRGASSSEQTAAPTPAGDATTTTTTTTTPIATTEAPLASENTSTTTSTTEAAQAAAVEEKSAGNTALADPTLTDVAEWPVATTIQEGQQQAKHDEKCGWFYNIFSFCMAAE